MHTTYISIARTGRLNALNALQVQKTRARAIAGHHALPALTSRDLDGLFLSSRAGCARITSVA